MARHTHDLPGNNETAKLLRRVTLASSGVAALLVLGKLLAWWQSGSLSMLSSLVDSCFDLLSSVLNMVAVRYAMKPADDDHRFGHTSIEDIASLAQSAFIAASMLIIMLQSISHLVNPVPIDHQGIGIAVSALGIVAATLLVMYQTFVTRRSKSLVIRADRLHYAGDIAFNAGVLVALYASLHYGWEWADPAMALAIALIVLWSSKHIGIHAFNNLMDHEMPDEEKARLYQVLKTYPELQGYHNLKTRYSGTKPFIQFHAEIDARLGFRAAHTIIDGLETALQEAFPGADVIVHPDPVEIAPPRAYDA